MLLRFWLALLGIVGTKNMNIEIQFIDLKLIHALKVATFPLDPLSS